MIELAPDLDPGLTARLEAASATVSVLLEAAKKLHHDQSLAQIHSLALYGTMVELFSACLGLASLGEMTAIPTILRSMYEALVDLDNLLHDASYVDHIQAANFKQTVKIMKSGPLQQALQEGHKADYEEFVAQLDHLTDNDKGPLHIRERCIKAGRLNEYESLYGLLCLDAHNNGCALAERHLSELPDGTILVSFFGPYDPQVIARRLDFGQQFLLQAGRMVHGAFQVPAPQLDELAARFDRERVRAA